MAENAQIDDDLFDRIHQAMLVRVTDKFPNVRIQAALAMTRLQQPRDPDCPTINGLYFFVHFSFRPALLTEPHHLFQMCFSSCCVAYMLILDNDSNAEVRRAVLSCIAMSPRTLPKVIKRTRDVKENVRKLAYQVATNTSKIAVLVVVDITVCARICFLF